MADERWQHPLYTTEAINDEGLEGHAYVPGGLKVQTSSPLNDHPGTNRSLNRVTGSPLTNERAFS